jgi:hypothetical protein
MADVPTTAAHAKCSNGAFKNLDGSDNPNRFTMDLTVEFNGRTGEVGEKVTWPVPTSLAGKQTAVRQRVNRFLAESEVLSERGITLTNAVIEISGLPT